MVGVVSTKEEECLLSEGETFSPTVIGGCGMCGQSFTDTSHLEEHIQNHKKANIHLHEPEEEEDDDIDQSKDAISDFIAPYVEEEETDVYDEVKSLEDDVVKDILSQLQDSKEIGESNNDNETPFIALEEVEVVTTETSDAGDVKDGGGFVIPFVEGEVTIPPETEARGVLIQEEELHHEDARVGKWRAER